MRPLKLSPGKRAAMLHLRAREPFLYRAPASHPGMAIGELYHQGIDAIVVFFGASHATMHVHAGLAIYLLVQLAVRTRRGSMVALHVVFLLEMGNEVLDRLAHGAWNWPDTLADIALTMMWPVAITLVSQYRRARWERLHRRAGHYRAAADALLARPGEAMAMQEAQGRR